jgi:TRAP-type mannitol/chloroaromatic compound transport system permease large subunit
MSQLKWWKLPNRHAHCQINPPLLLTAAQLLIILADVLGVPVGDLFQGAIMPSVVLVGGYIIYVLVVIRHKAK